MSTIKLLKTMRAAMKDQKITQEYLAKFVGVSRPTMSMFLSGKRELGNDTLQSLLYKLGIIELGNKKRGM